MPSSKEGLKDRFSEEGRNYRQVAARYFPGGSFGNGAAMRVAPVGLLFRGDRE